MPDRLEALLKGYLAHRRDAESFHEFANRQSVTELKTLLAMEPAL